MPTKTKIMRKIRRFYFGLISSTWHITSHQMLYRSRKDILDEFQYKVQLLLSLVKERVR